MAVSESVTRASVEGRRAVVRRRVTYVEPDGPVKSHYDTCWLLDFDGEGRCAEYHERSMETPAVPG